VKVVFGPGTFINEAVRQLGAGLARRVARDARQARAAAASAHRAARRQGLGAVEAGRRAARARAAVDERSQAEIVALAVRYGLRAIPRIDDPSFISTLVFDASKPAGTPKRRFAYLFPSRDGGPGDAALVQVRLQAWLDEAQRNEALELIRAAVAMADWKPRNGSTYTVTGAPVVVAELASSIAGSLLALLVAALVVMAATLALVFRGRPRLLPLAIALAAAALTFGLLSLVGGSLTMASIAVLPVLIGLAVDYAIQLQSRIGEEGADLDAAPAARRAALLGAPSVAAAAAATAAGFAVLALSPVPMVRGVGLLLAAGIAFSFVCASMAVPAALVLAERARSPAAPAGLGGIGARIAAAMRTGAARVTAAAPVRAARARAGAAVRATLAYATRRPARVLAVGLAGAAAGWALGTQTRVESDIQKLVPQDLPALRDLDARRRGRRPRRRGRPDPSAGDRVDGGLPVRRAEALRLQRRPRLRACRAVPGVLAARPLHDGALATRRR
jgi:hypothetical protein